MKPSLKRRLGMESLEARELMAGDVTVRVTSAGHMIINGDELANEFAVVQSGPATYQVTGTGTTINGSSTAKTFSGVTGNTIVNTYAGNDVVTFGEVGRNTRLLGDVSVRTGSGADKLFTQSVFGKNALAIMGANSELDADRIVVRRTRFSGSTRLQTGGGNDVMFLVNAQSLISLRIDLAGGSDSATVTNGTVGDITLNCGAGNDTGTFAGKLTVTGEVVANGGAGNDTATKKPGTILDVSDTTPTLLGFEVDEIS